MTIKSGEDRARRDVLKRAGLAGLVAVAGGSAACSKSEETASPSSASTDQPRETDLKPKRPLLATPWTTSVSTDQPLPDYPRPQLTRPRWINLNGVWQFAAARDGEAPPVGRDLAERILVPYPVESALSGIMRHEDRMFYRRRFVVPGDWNVGSGNRLLLNFDAVDYQATIWVDGKPAGDHKGGYDRFTLDITDVLGSGKDHELIVGVFDPTENGVQPIGKQHVDTINNPKSSLYYTPASGIWQTVWLEVVPASYIQRLELTPDLPGGALNVVVHASGQGGTVELTASDGGRAVGAAKGPAGQPIRLAIPDAKTWSPESPFLYDLKVRLIGPDGKASDEVGSYFGMRSIGLTMIDGHAHIMLNGKRAFLLSTLQQGFWPDGVYTPATEAALIFDLEQNKRLGFNGARKHQKVEPDRWYYHADRLGQMVWQDMPAASKGRQPPHQARPGDPPAAAQAVFEGELRQMIERLRNYPSIVIWTPFNEGWGEYDAAQIANMVKGWDPSRLIDAMSGINVCDCGAEGGDLLDRHNLGKIDVGPMPQPMDGRAAVIGELGALGLTMPGHSWDAANAHPNVKVKDVAAMAQAYVQIMKQVEGFARGGLTAANYNLFEDAEHQTNGLFTYDRALLKIDAGLIRAANAAVVKAGLGQ